MPSRDGRHQHPVSNSIVTNKPPSGPSFATKRYSEMSNSTVQKSNGQTADKTQPQGDRQGQAVVGKAQSGEQEVRTVMNAWNNGRPNIPTQAQNPSNGKQRANASLASSRSNSSTPPSEAKSDGSHTPKDTVAESNATDGSESNSRNQNFNQHNRRPNGNGYNGRPRGAGGNRNHRGNNWQSNNPNFRPTWQQNGPRMGYQAQRPIVGSQPFPMYPYVAPHPIADFNYPHPPDCIGCSQQMIQQSMMYPMIAGPGYPPGIIQYLPQYDPAIAGGMFLPQQMMQVNEAMPPQQQPPFAGQVRDEQIEAKPVGIIGQGPNGNVAGNRPAAMTPDKINGLTPIHAAEYQGGRDKPGQVQVNNGVDQFAQRSGYYGQQLPIASPNAQMQGQDLIMHRGQGQNMEGRHGNGYPVMLNANTVNLPTDAGFPTAFPTANNFYYRTYATGPQP